MPTECLLPPASRTSCRHKDGVIKLSPGRAFPRTPAHTCYPDRSSRALTGKGYGTTPGPPPGGPEPTRGALRCRPLPRGCSTRTPAGRRWRTRGHGPSRGAGGGFSEPAPGFQSWARAGQGASGGGSRGPEPASTAGIAASPSQAVPLRSSGLAPGAMPQARAFLRCHTDGFPNRQSLCPEDGRTSPGLRSGSTSRARLCPPSGVAPLGEVQAAQSSRTYSPLVLRCARN